MKKRNGLRLMATTMLCTSLLLPSNVIAQTASPMNGIGGAVGGIGGAVGGIGGAVGGIFGGDRATKTEQFAQIALAKEQLESLFQAVEALQLGGELMAIFEQMFGIQSIVEDVMVYEPPQDLVERHEIINPMEHKRLTEERNNYLMEIDAEFAAIKNEVALDPNQMHTLTLASERISEPRSNIVATQAQFLADQAALEQDRRQMAIELIDKKNAEIKNQIISAHIASRDAALKCIREKKSTDEC